jgi:hypothetical protein
MSNQNPRDYTNLSKNLCITQMSEASKTRRLVRYLIQENAGVEESWTSQLMSILCEYYVTIHQYYELLGEVLFEAPFNEERPEYLMVDMYKVKTLRAHVSLLQINEYDLLYNYRISLTIH